MRALLLSVLFVAGFASAALASSSAWHQAEGARLRIVTSGAPDAGGWLRGALQIDLKPGWKTYWRDPGASGVPPAIDTSASPNISKLEVAYPAPTRFNDQSGSWVGYKQSVVFPIAFQLSPSHGAKQIDADVFIGACETICIPVQASLSVDPNLDPDNPHDAAVIASASGALPRAATPEFGVTLLSVGEDEIEVAATFLGNPEAADLFVAGADGYSLGAPEKRVAEGKTTFVIPLLERSGEKPKGKGLPYTLVTDAGAVAGYLPYP